MPDYLGAFILHTLVQIYLIFGDKLPSRTLREEREDGHARMSIDNRNLHIPHARIRQIGGELVGLDDVESRYTKDLAVVETQLHTVTLTIAFWREFPTGFEERPDDASVDPKEVITVIPGFRGIPA